MPWCLPSFMRAPWRSAIAAVALAAGCSDDGLTPSAGGTGADGGSGGSTGSVSTTVTASAGGGDPTGGGQAEDAGPDDGGTVGLSDTGGRDETGRGQDSGGLADSSGRDDAEPGSTGDAGTSTGGDTDGPGTSGMTCVSSADCVVIDDCCGCTAAHAEDLGEVCKEEKCDTTQCEAEGVFAPVAECVFGHCQLEKAACNGAFLACDLPPPDCPDGMLPTVDDDGECWTGACVTAEACDVVPACSFCAPGDACVLTATQIAPLYSCWPIDPACDGTPSCACMGEVCTGPFVCGDDGAGAVDLDCFCPVC